jgi:hypothetical protein
MVVRRTIAVFLSGLCVLTVAGCGSRQGRTVCAGTSAVWSERSTPELIRALHRHSRWVDRDISPDDPDYRLKMDYYVVHDLLQQRRQEKGVLDGFMDLLRRTNSDIVGRDMVRSIAGYYDIGVDVTDMLAGVYNDSRTSLAVRHEILDTFRELGIKSTSVAWRIMDSSRVDSKSVVEQQYMRFLETE